MLLRAEPRIKEVVEECAPPPNFKVLNFQQTPLLRGFQEGVRYKARILRNTGGVYGTYVEDFRRVITQ